MRRIGGALVIAMALALYASPAGAQEASVGATDFGTFISAFPIPGDDGGTCTGVPDTIPGIFDFTEACAAHDECYAAGEQTRLACDLAFRQDMIAACQVQHPSPLDARRYACLAFAELYFNGVRVFGQFV
jgi:hypothetical protein